MISEELGKVTETGVGRFEGCPRGRMAACVNCRPCDDPDDGNNKDGNLVAGGETGLKSRDKRADVFAVTGRRQRCSREESD